MRLGLLGCGSVAYWIHSRAIRRIPGVSLAGAADPDPGARLRAERALRVPVYERAEVLLDRPEIDAVLVCAPTPLHAELAIAAAVAGKHLYLEKPMSTTLLDAHAVEAAVRRAGVTAVLGFNRRFHPLFEQARSLVSTHAIGRVIGVQSAFCEPVGEAMPAWKRRRSTGGGVLLDLASHLVDQLRWTLGEEIEVRSSHLRSDASEHDSGRLTLDTESGVAIQAYFSFRGGPSDYLEFIGEQGSCRVDRHSGRLWVRRPRAHRYGSRATMIPPSPTLAAWRLERLWRPAADPSYRRAIEAFVRQIRTGMPGRAASLTDGLRSLEVVLAAEAVAQRPAGATC